MSKILAKPFQLRFAIQSDFAYLPFLTRLFKGWRVPKAAALTQVLVEAFNNAVLHAHRRRREKWIRLEIRLDRRGAKIVVEDEGKGLRSERGGFPSTWASHGRGLGLINALADRVSSRKKSDGHSLEIGMDWKQC